MLPYVHVSFRDQVPDSSLEGAAHRWVARLEAMSFEVRTAATTIERAGRGRTAVQLTLVLADGTRATTASSHADPFVAVSEAFRAARRSLLETIARSRPQLRLAT